jgi:hypothetical protein
MWLPASLFTLGTIVVAAQQFRYWGKYGKGSEKWVSLGFMITAWVMGILFISGLKFPVPVHPLLPEWK